MSRLIHYKSGVKGRFGAKDTPLDDHTRNNFRYFTDLSKVGYLVVTTSSRVGIFLGEYLGTPTEY